MDIDLGYFKYYFYKNRILLVVDDKFILFETVKNIAQHKVILVIIITEQKQNRLIIYNTIKY